MIEITLVTMDGELRILNLRYQYQLNPPYFTTYIVCN